MNIKNKSLFKNLKVNYNVIYILLSLVFTAIIIVVNMIAKNLTDKYSLTWDLTPDKVFGLTEDSINYLQSLNKDVEIIVLNSRDKFLENGDYYIQSDSVINKYANYSDRIKISYINLDENPSIKSQYPSDEIDTNDIIVRSADKYKILSAYDIFNIQSQYSGHSIVSSKAEQAMTSAIMNVTSDKKVSLNMITGFDEIESSSFQDFLNINNYDINTLSMLTDDFNDTPVSIIYAPNRDYDDQTITKLKNYLYNDGNYGRNLVYFVNPGRASLPKIENFLKEWGISVNDGLVFETDEYKTIMGKPFNIICEYVDNAEYSDLIKNKSIPVCMPISRPLEVLDSNKVLTLLKFSETSGIMPSNVSSDWAPTRDNIQGNIPCMVISTNKNDDTGSKSTVTVVASAVAVDSSILSRGSLNNSEYFLNFFNKLTERKDVVNIASKSMGYQELNMNPHYVLVIGIVFALVLPILLLITGIVVWLIRRKK